MSKPRTLVVTVPGMIEEADLAPLRERSDVVYDERSHISEDELGDLCTGFDYLMLNYDVVKRIEADFYSRPSVKALKLISFDMTGMDWASPYGATSANVRLAHIPHYSTESVAESIVCEILLHTRQRHSAYVDEIKGREVKARSGINVLNRTAGVVGLGSIGTRVAELLAALGMNVIAWNRTPRPGYALTSLDDLFARSDVICIALRTVETGPDSNVGIVNKNVLAKCKNSVIVNLANVALVNNDDMVAAIEAGTVTGYTVEHSQKLLESPLGGLECVHFPPSNAWSSEESLAMLRQIWVGNILAAMDSKPENLLQD